MRLPSWAGRHTVLQAKRDAKILPKKVEERDEGLQKQCREHVLFDDRRQRRSD